MTQSTRAFHSPSLRRVFACSETPSSTKDRKSTALLVAPKYGPDDLMEILLKDYPVAINDKTDLKKRNIVLLAVLKRQTHVFKFSMKQPLWPSLREAVDIDGNNVLHMASFLLQHMPRKVQGSHANAI